MAPLQFKTVISARDNGTILVERFCHNVLVDRYTTADLKIGRKHRAWVRPITLAALTPLGVTVPPPDEQHWQLWREYVASESEVQP